MSAQPDVATNSAGSVSGCELSMFCNIKDIKIIGGSYETAVAKVIYDPDATSTPPPAPIVQNCSVKVLSASAERVEVDGQFSANATLVVPVIKPIPQPEPAANTPFNDYNNMPPPRPFEPFGEPTAFRPMSLLESPADIEIRRRYFDSMSPQLSELALSPSEMGHLRGLPQEHLGLLMTPEQERDQAQ